MDLSVVVVSYKVRDWLRQCLITTARASENIDCEIFVVDNNSEDGSVEMIKIEFPEIRLIVNPSNIGFSAANNQAIKMATGRYILLLNPDTVVADDVLSKCKDFMDSHADAGAVGIRMLNGEGQFLPESKRAFPDPATAFFKISGISRLFCRSGYFNRYYLPHIDNQKVSPTEVISGAFMFIRREALDKAGLFDEDFFMYGEDIDLSYRLMCTGYKNYYFPEVSIVHYKGRSTGRNSFKDIRHFYDAMRIYVRKRASEGNYRPFIFLFVIAIYIAEGLAILKRSLRITLRG